MEVQKSAIQTCDSRASDGGMQATVATRRRRGDTDPRWEAVDDEHTRVKASQREASYAGKAIPDGSRGRRRRGAEPELGLDHVALAPSFLHDPYARNDLSLRLSRRASSSSLYPPVFR